MGRLASPGCRAILQSRGPEASLHPVINCVPWVSFTIAASRVKVTVQSASQSGPTPIKVWRKPGIICPVIGNPDGIWDKFKSPVPLDCCVWPVAVPTLNVDYGGICGKVDVSSSGINNACCWYVWTTG